MVLPLKLPYLLLVHYCDSFDLLCLAMCLLAFILVCLVYHFNGYLAASTIPGYYWRDFTGDLIEDILPGGIENENTTLIGQVLYKGELIPAKVIPFEKKAYFEWGRLEQSVSSNIKVLCTNRPVQFDWIKSSSQDFPRITDKHFVVGGNQQDNPVYIGRARYHNEVLLGRIIVNPYAVLHTSKDGIGILQNQFHVLAFNKESVNAMAEENVSNQCSRKSITVNFYDIAEQ